MNLAETRATLLKMREQIAKEMSMDAFLHAKCGRASMPDRLSIKAMAAIDALDDYLLFAIAQEALSQYSEEELMSMGRPNNLMGHLIVNRQISLTPTPGAKGADCLAYKDVAEENGCHACPWQKTCFPDGLSLMEAVNA